MLSKITAFPSGLRYIFSTSNSSIIPPSRAQRLLLPMWEVAPNIQSLTSLEALPPNTGLSCTNTTLMPHLAAAIEAHTPEIPPPTTTRSATIFSWVKFLNNLFESIIICKFFENVIIPFCPITVYW